MGRERDDSGRFVETVTAEQVLAVFDRVDGPVVTSADVADALDCSRETARQKLHSLYERGRLDRRETAGRMVYWRSAGAEPNPIDPDDPFWDLEPFEGGEAVDVEAIDDILYGEVEGT